MRNPNGYGSVYKLSGKNRRKPFIVQKTLGYDQHGKRQYEILGYFEKREEALKFLGRYNNGEVLKNDMTLSHVYNDWSRIHFKNISIQLQNNYAAAYKRLEPIENKKASEIRTGEMQSIIDSTPLGRSSLHKIKILLVQLFKYAMENDIVSKNYAAFIKLPKEIKLEKDIFTDIEIQKIEKAAKKGTPFADCILMMIYTGFRIEEFLTLTPFSYNAAEMTLTGGIKTEAGRGRIVPIHQKIAPYITKWLNKGGQTIICRENGLPYSASLFRKTVFYPALAEIGIQKPFDEITEADRKLTPHATRHTFATILSKRNANTKSLQTLIGHTDYAFTQNTYTHFDVEELRKAINLL